MKTAYFIVALILISLTSQAQYLSTDPYDAVLSTDYTIELAIKYEDKLLSEMPWSKNTLSLGVHMYGDISLKIIDDTERLSAIDTPTFQIAIKDNKSGTQRMFSNQIYTEINAETIVDQCKEGESIIILTTNRKYTLPQNVIKLMIDGC